MNISLTPELERFVADKVNSGMYQTSSEVIREGLRLLKDAGLAAHPSGRFDVNRNHFQLAMPAYNLNCWLMLFNREPQDDATELRHITLATSRLRFLFIAAKIWRHAGRTGVSYSDHYEEQGLFQRLMDRLRRIVPGGSGYAPVLQPALR